MRRQRASILANSIKQGSLDEQHFLIGRQRPEVVGDEAFELVAGGADGVHGGDDRVAGMLGVSQRIAFGMLLDDRVERVGRRLELFDRRDELAQVGRLDLGDGRAGGLEAGDRLGDLAPGTAARPAGSFRLAIWIVNCDSMLIVLRYPSRKISNRE